MVVRARMVEKHRLAQIGPDGQRRLAEVVGERLQLGRVLLHPGQETEALELWASQPWPFCTWSTMVGRRSATWVRELTSG